VGLRLFAFSWVIQAHRVGVSIREAPDIYARLGQLDIVIEQDDRSREMAD
jgi:hypothetical protein